MADAKVFCNLILKAVHFTVFQWCSKLNLCLWREGYQTTSSTCISIIFPVASIFTRYPVLLIDWSPTKCLSAWSHLFCGHNNHNQLLDTIMGHIIAQRQILYQWWFIDWMLFTKSIRVFLSLASLVLCRYWGENLCNTQICLPLGYVYA